MLERSPPWRKRHGSRVQSSALSRRDFLADIHYFRAFAIVAIVLGHCVTATSFTEGSTVDAWIRIVFRNGTVFFVFIAGLLFQHLSAGFSYRKYLTTKLKRVVVPYIVISIPILVLTLTRQVPEPAWIEASPYGDLSGPVKVLFYLVSGAHLRQLWFIPMICLFYLAAPAWVWIDRNRWGYWLIVPTIALSLLLPRDGWDDEDFHILRRFGHFVSVYLMGMAFSRHRELALRWVGRIWPLLLAVVVVSAAAQFLNWPGDRAWNYPQKVSLCFLLSYALSRIAPRVPVRTGKALARLADDSFAIYFLHDYAILFCVGELVRGSGSSPFTGLMGFIGLSTATLFLTIGTVVLLRRTLGERSRWLIGA